MRLTSHSHSPSIFGKIVRTGARQHSFKDATDVLKDLAEIRISSRQLSRIAHEVGRQLETRRDQSVQELRNKQLTPDVATRPALAIVEVDGGRLQIRGEATGPGAHNAAWHEDKIALLATAASVVSEVDPEPDLPACFRNRTFVEGLLSGIARQSCFGESDPPPETERSAESTTDPPKASRNRPELLVRTYVASMRGSDDFGPMVAAEAEKRNFKNAARKVFVGDGSAWIWTLQKQYFPTFTTVVDFLHVLGHLFAAAKASATDPEERWTLFQTWTEACWKGQVDKVIASLQARLADPESRSDENETTLADDDPRTILAEQLGYLERNQPRMNYPSDRREGLPWTSSHIESTVKIFNRRVKGTEKFWSESGAEAILQLRGAFLSEDDRLAKHLKNQPCSPFRTYETREVRKVA